MPSKIIYQNYLYDRFSTKAYISIYDRGPVFFISHIYFCQLQGSEVLQEPPLHKWPQ